MGRARRTRRLRRQRPGCPRGHHLIERALPGLLVGAPAQELGAVPEAATGEMVVAHLADQDRAQRLPVGRAPLAPAAGSSRAPAGEARRLDERHHQALDLAALGVAEAGAETDVVEQALLVVEAEQQRAQRGAGPGPAE